MLQVRLSPHREDGSDDPGRTNPHHVAERGQPEADATGYQAHKVDELKAEIARRNADRDESDQLSADGKKADLVAVLEADDAASGTGE